MWWQGLLDALQFPSVYRVSKRDSVLRTLIYQCFLLNGVIFVGSHLLFTKGIQPLTSYFFKFDETVDPSLQSLIWMFQQFYWIAYLVIFSLFPLFCFALIDSLTHNLSLACVCKIFWQFPVYGISFLLNGIWYEEISLRVYQYHYPPQTFRMNVEVLQHRNM